MVNLRLISITGMIAALSFSMLQGCGDDDDDGGGTTGGTGGSGTGGSGGGKAGSGGSSTTGGSGGSPATGGSAGSTSTGGTAGSTSAGGAAGTTGGGAGGATAGAAGSSTAGAGGGKAGECAQICNGPKGIVELCKDADLKGGTEYDTAGACVTDCDTWSETVRGCRYDHWEFMQVASPDTATHCPHVYGGGTAPADCKE